jgi:serine/threonine protein kinase
VNIVGYSINPFAMLMEKMDQGNLYNYLHDDKNSLSWPLRFKIAENIADGMAYLHSFEPKILHQDLKSPNVLVQYIIATLY